jgi:hypothetical protein
MNIENRIILHAKMLRCLDKDVAHQSILKSYPDHPALVSRILDQVYDVSRETIDAQIDCVLRTLEDNKDGEGKELDAHGMDKVDRAVYAAATVISKKVEL